MYYFRNRIQPLQAVSTIYTSETNNSLDGFLPFLVEENEIIPYTCQFHSFQQYIENDFKVDWNKNVCVYVCVCVFKRGTLRRDILINPNLADNAETQGT